MVLLYIYLHYASIILTCPAAVPEMINYVEFHFIILINHFWIPLSAPAYDTYKIIKFIKKIFVHFSKCLLCHTSYE